MKTKTKVALGCLPLLVLFVFFVIGAWRFVRGFDASEKDPTELYSRYIQERIPGSVRIHSVTGNHSPFGGTGFIFKFAIGPKDLEELIAAKQLVKYPLPPPPHLFEEELKKIKHPELYVTPMKGEPSGRTIDVTIAVDRENNEILYQVYSP